MFQTPFQCLQTDTALWSCVMFLGIGRDLDHKDRAGDVYCCLAVSPCGQLNSRKPGAGGAHTWGQCVPEARWPGRGSDLPSGCLDLCSSHVFQAMPRVPGASLLRDVRQTETGVASGGSPRAGWDRRPGTFRGLDGLKAFLRLVCWRGQAASSFYTQPSSQPPPGISGRNTDRASRGGITSLGEELPAWVGAIPCRQEEGSAG